MSLNHSFDIDLATKYGALEAVLISHFQYWILHNQKLGRNQKEGKTWTFQTRKEIAAYFPYLQMNHVRRLCESLVEQGVLETRNFNKKGFDKTLWYAFVNEEEMLGIQKNFTKGKFASRCGKFATPIPNPKSSYTKTSISKGKSYQNPNPCGDPSEPSDLGFEDLKDLPFSVEKKEEPRGKSTRKYPRSLEEQKTFLWLKSLNLNTNENTLSFWAHKFPRKKLEDAWNHLSYKMSKGYIPANIGGLFKKLLDSEMSPVTQDCLSNKQLAENFKNNMGWPSLELRERFCCDDDRPDYDLPYVIPEKDFKERLVRMWELKTGRTFTGTKKDIKQNIETEDHEDFYDD